MVLADPRVSAFFTGVDMSRQKAMMVEFLTMATGGERRYTGRDLKTAHEHLVADGLNADHFCAVIGHLGAALKSAGVDEITIGDVLIEAKKLQNDVIGTAKKEM